MSEIQDEEFVFAEESEYPVCLLSVIKLIIDEYSLSWSDKKLLLSNLKYANSVLCKVCRNGGVDCSTINNVCAEVLQKHEFQDFNLAVFVNRTNDKCNVVKYQLIKSKGDLDLVKSVYQSGTTVVVFYYEQVMIFRMHRTQLLFKSAIIIYFLYLYGFLGIV